MMRNRRSKHILIITFISPLLLLFNLSYFYNDIPIFSNNSLRKITSNIVTSSKIPNSYFSTINPSSLKYVALGTSVTWGQGLDNRNTQTYIKLLSSQGINLAIRASDASYASLCTQTLLDGATNTNSSATYYDVIVIEYERRYEDGLSTLVYRIRKRYPNAIIVLTDIWTFMNVYVVIKHKNKSATRTIPFVNWLKENGIMKNEKQAYDFIKNGVDSLAAKNNVDIKFVFSKMLFDRSTYLNTLAEEYDLHVYSWDKVQDHDVDVRDILLKYLPYYHRDFIHLSIRGHEDVATNIRNMVTSELKKRRQNMPLFLYRHGSNVKSSSSDMKLGDWGDGDFCSFWVDNGIIPNTYTPPTPSLTIPKKESNKIKMIKFDKLKHKYALQFPFGEENNYELQIINPFNQSRTLSVAYMATGPNTTIYPLTEITILPPDDVDTKVMDTAKEKTFISSRHKSILDIMKQYEAHNKNVNHEKDKPNILKQKQSIIINPIVNTYNYPVHVQLVTTVGIVKPGINVIQVNPFGSSDEPFRLVGFAITNTNFTLSKIFERASPLDEQRK